MIFGELLAKVFTNKWVLFGIALVTLILVIAGAGWYFSNLKSQNAAYQNKISLLDSELVARNAQIDALAEQGKRNAKLAEEKQAEKADRDQKVKTIVKEVYRDKPVEVKTDCESVLHPISVGIDGVRKLKTADH